MSTANSKLKIDYGFDSYGTSNVTGDFRVSGNVFIQGTILSSIKSEGDFIPVTSGLQLGNTTNRWTVLANSGNFSNTLTVTGAGSFQDELTVTKTINASNNVVITGFANATVSVNSALLTVGSNFIANVTGTYHTGTVNAASHTVGTSFIANSTAIIGGGYANITTSVNSALLTVGTNFIANVTGAYHTGTVNAASYTTTGFVANTTAITPTSNTILLGNSIGRFVISANTADFSGTVSGTVANMSTSVNSALLTVGTSFIANTSGAYHTGTINSVSITLSNSSVIGIVTANNSGVYPSSNAAGTALGSSTQRWVVNGNTGNFSGTMEVSGTTTLTGNATLSGTLQTIAGNTNFDNGTLFVDAANNRVGVNNTAPTVALEVTGAANISTSVNSALLTVGGSFTANTTGTYPGSNTVGSALGASTQRWVINANTGNFSGLITGSAGANIAGTANLADVNISGNLNVSGTTTYIDTTTLNVGDNIVTLNADLGALVAPTENAGLEVNRGSSANVSFLWNESSDSWTHGNTDITGYANASVSLSVGTSFIANTGGAYHTGTINAASFTTTNFIANTSGSYPLSNTAGSALGSTTQRWAINASTGNFTGTVTGTVANMSTSVNSALLTVGTSFIANTSGAVVPSQLVVSGGNATGEGGQIVLGYGNNLASSITSQANNTFSFDIIGGNTASTPILRAYFQNNDGSTTYAFSAANTGRVHVGSSAEQTDSTFKVTGSANVTTTLNVVTSLTANAFVANASGAYHTGLINAASHTTTGFVANTTAIAPTSNTILLGNTIGRFVISANTADFSGTVSGTVANMSTSVNSALLTVGTSFIANTTGAYHTGTINAASISVGSGSFIANATAVVISDALTANGTTGTSGQILASNGASGSPYWITPASVVVALSDDISTVATYYPTFVTATSGTTGTLKTSSTKLTFDPSTGTLTSTIVTASSDEKLKTNIRTIEDPIDILAKLRGVSFDRIDSGLKDYGVIAQEIEEVLPDTVHTDPKGYKSVSYNSIIGFLIEAVKKQQDQINILMLDKYPK